MKLHKPICIAEDKTEYERCIPSKRLIDRSNIFVVETKDNYVIIKNRNKEDVITTEFEKLNRGMYSSWQEWENYKPKENGFNICFDISDRM